MLSILGFVCSLALAASISHKGFSPQLETRLLRHNEAISSGANETIPNKIERPFSELEDVGYLVIDADFTFDSQVAKLAIAQALPANVTLVVVARDSHTEYQARMLYSGALSPDRYLSLIIPGGAGFWLRDSLPVPVYSNGRVLGIDARYGHGYEPDAPFSNFLNFPVLSHPFFFEGGNFTADREGNCYVVNNRTTATIPDETFTNYYGCKSLRRMAHEGGIGHIDERVRLFSDKKLFTDSENYRQLFASNGMEAILLPRPAHSFETYANAILVNGTAFVPEFGQPTDKIAQEAYASMGFTVVGADSSRLSNEGRGSLHCISMLYPRMPTQQLLALLQNNS